MGRSIGALGFVALLAVGVIAAWAGTRSSDQFGAPPDQLVQYDEQATAAFNESAATRNNVNQLLIVLSITIGLTGVIVVGVGHLTEDDV